MYTNTHTHFSFSKENEIRNVEPGERADYFHSVGIHPWKADSVLVSDVIDVLVKSINEQTLAIGECGLDGMKGPAIPVQSPIFEQHILLSEEIKLPLIIHCVKAWNELHALRKKYNPVQPWIFHGFLKYGILHQVVRSGMMISLGTGIIHHPKREEIVQHIPDHQLLLETDDVQIEIKQVYEGVAALKKISLHDLKNQVNTNFKNTFTKWQIG